MIARDTFMEAIDQLPPEVRNKLNAMVSDLTCLSEICSHLITRLQEIQNFKQRMIDVKSFEKGLEKMPELLRLVTITMVQRLNLAIEKCSQLTTSIEEIVKPVESLSLALAKNKLSDASAG